MITKQRESNSLEEKCSKLHFLLEEQWQQNYFIKNKNIELEDKVKELQDQIKRLTVSNSN